jgi:pimeloyl-ACP methyl ester carboxylesterase
VDVAPILATEGCRVIVPYLRGYGTTRFRAEDTIRSGQQAAVASDITALMDALKIEKAVLGGFDWGARTGVVIAALWPERCRALVSVGGYALNNPDHVSIVIHNYRWRLSLAKGAPSTTVSSRSSPGAPSLRRRQSPWRVTSTVPPPMARLIGSSSPESTNTESCGISDTTFRKRRRESSPERSSTPTDSDIHMQL